MALKHPFQCAFLVFMALTAIIFKPTNPCRTSEIAHFGIFELQLELVRNQSDELRIAFWCTLWHGCQNARNGGLHQVVYCAVYGKNDLVFIKLLLL